MIDDYKVKYLNLALEKMEKDEYFSPSVRVSEEGRYLNLDEGAIKLLIKYYKGKIENG